MYDRILLPTDGSEGSERARETALALAEQFGSGLHVMHVIDTRLFSEPALSTMELVTDEAETRAMELLEDIAGTAEGQGLDVELRCCHGVPHREIVAYADEVDADLLVMGYQGQTHEEKVGSVVDRVVHATGRQVLVV